MTTVGLLAISVTLLTVGGITGLALCLLVAGAWRISTRRAADEPTTLDEEIEAQIELHAIRRRLEVAKARAEIHRSSDSLRQKIAEELRERRS